MDLDYGGWTVNCWRKPQIGFHRIGCFRTLDLDVLRTLDLNYFSRIWAVFGRIGFQLVFERINWFWFISLS